MLDDVFLKKNEFFKCLLKFSTFLVVRSDKEEMKQSMIDFYFPREDLDSANTSPTRSSTSLISQKFKAKEEMHKNHPAFKLALAEPLTTKPINATVMSLVALAQGDPSFNHLIRSNFRN